MSREFQQSGESAEPWTYNPDMWTADPTFTRTHAPRARRQTKKARAKAMRTTWTWIAGLLIVVVAVAGARIVQIRRDAAAAAAAAEDIDPRPTRNERAWAAVHAMREADRALMATAPEAGSWDFDKQLAAHTKLRRELATVAAGVASMALEESR